MRSFVFVDAPRNVRLARALARGWSESDFAAREGAQESLDLKRGRADVIIDNSGSRGTCPSSNRAFLAVPCRLTHPRRFRRSAP